MTDGTTSSWKVSSASSAKATLSATPGSTTSVSAQRIFRLGPSLDRSPEDPESVRDPAVPLASSSKGSMGFQKRLVVYIDVDDTIVRCAGSWCSAHLRTSPRVADSALQQGPHSLHKHVISSARCWPQCRDVRSAYGPPLRYPNSLRLARPGDGPSRCLWSGGAAECQY